MRIIGGKLKGKVIAPPAGYKARPTTDFAKEGLFNILDNEYEFQDLKVLDLFGGTGSIAFEFASRGAARVYCVEMARENASFIKTEAQRLGLANVTMVRDNVFDFPTSFPSAGKNSTLCLPTLRMRWRAWKTCRIWYLLPVSCTRSAISFWSMGESTVLSVIPGL